MGEGLIISVASFLLVFTVLVFFHELGHYLVARLNGVRVSVFSIGFGREIVGWTDAHGTRWKVSAIPLGGYVKFFGDMGVASAGAEADEGLSEEEKQETFHHKRLGQRAAVVAAGPIANFILAIVVMAAVFMIVGRPLTPPVVEDVVANTPAAAAGLESGDRIVSVDGKEIERFEELQQIVRFRPGEELTFGILRDGERLTMAVTPRAQEVETSFGDTQTIGFLGVSRTANQYQRLGPGKALTSAVGQTASILQMTFEAVGQMVVGTRSTEQLGGPIRIAQMSGEVAQQGVTALAMFVAMLSINLGLINLFPIPMLDGGHLLFYGFEAILGRPLSEQAQEVGLRIGLTLVLMLMVFVTWNDLVSLPFGDLFSRIFS